MTEPNSRLSFGQSTQIILIGTANYPVDPTLQDIPQVRSNLDNLLSIFLDPGIIGISSRSITSIFNEEHPSELLNKVNTKAVTALDTLFIYYAGHGLYGDEDSPLYLTATSTTDAGKSFNGVDYNKLKRIISSCPAKQKIVVLDCCYSGSALEGGLSASITTDVADIAGTFVMTASAANKKALAPPENRHTLFTGALIDVLENGRERFSSTISLGEVYSDIYQSLTKGTGGPKPERSTWKDVEDFRIAFNQFGRERGTNQALAMLQNLETSVERLNELESEKSAQVQKLSQDHAVLERKIAFIQSSLKADMDYIKIEVSQLQKELGGALVFVWLYRLRFVLVGFFSLIGILVLGLWLANL